MDLTESEYQMFVKLAANCDQKTKKLCLQYYLEYKTILIEENRQEQFLSDSKIQIIMQCTFFMSQKSQTMYNIKGDKIRGVSLSLTQTLKSYNNLDQFVFHLKEIIRKIHLIDQEAETQINNFIKKFCFILTYHNKFNSVFKRIDLQPIPITKNQNPLNSHKEYLKLVMSFGWLLFINSKAKILKNSYEIVDVTCLLVSVFRFIINLTSDYLKCSFFSQLQKDPKSPREYKEACCQSLLEFFKIRDLKIFERINLQFQNYVNSNLLNQNFRYTTGNDFMCLENLPTNYKKLDNMYQKTLSDPDDIDQRYFLKERINLNLTPSRFTPFGGRGTATKWKKQQHFNSQRILNYELDETIKDPVLITTTKLPQVPLLNQQINNPTAIKFPKQFTPSLTKPSIFSTPMTQAMQMYNWIAEKPKKPRTNSMFEKILDKIISLEKKQPDQKSKENRKNLIWQLYEDAIQNSGSYSNDSTAILCWAIQSVYYILNLSGVVISKIVQIVDVDWYNLWRVTDYFIKYDKNMPNSLKCHILDIQTRIISMQLWKIETDLIYLFNPTHSFKYLKKYPEGQRFTRRIIHQIAYQIHLLSTQFKLTESVSNSILSTIQHIMCYQSNLLIKHHLDQLMLCSIYSLSKILNLKLKFNQIIIKYRQVNGYTKQIYNEIIEQVHMQGRREDIISFYNTYFIPSMKGYLLELKNKPSTSTITNNNTKNQNKQNALNLLGSPIKNLIPKQLFGMKGNMNMTPQTQMLYAYNESPLLRGQECSESKSNLLYTKKLLNFENELEETSKKKYESIKSESLTNFNEFQDTSDFINRKFNKKQQVISGGTTATMNTKSTLQKTHTQQKLVTIKSKQKL